MGLTSLKYSYTGILSLHSLNVLGHAEGMRNRTRFLKSTEPQ